VVVVVGRGGGGGPRGVRANSCAYCNCGTCVCKANRARHANGVRLWAALAVNPLAALGVKPTRARRVGDCGAALAGAGGTTGSGCQGERGGQGVWGSGAAEARSRSGRCGHLVSPLSLGLFPEPVPVGASLPVLRWWADRDLKTQTSACLDRCKYWTRCEGGCQPWRVVPAKWPLLEGWVDTGVCETSGGKRIRERYGAAAVEAGVCGAWCGYRREVGCQRSRGL
jgi:hypothetical protein